LLGDQQWQIQRCGAIEQPITLGQQTWGLIHVGEQLLLHINEEHG